MEVKFLSYKPNIYQFLYNVTRQISETWLFSNVAPVIIGQNLCFLFHKNAETKERDLYQKGGPWIFYKKFQINYFSLPNKMIETEWRSNFCLTNPTYTSFYTMLHVRFLKLGFLAM